MRVTLDHIEVVAPSTRTLWFKPEQELSYIAGQFIELYLPHEGEDNRGQKRWFTLSSSPTEPLLAITTKFSGDTSSSFKKNLLSLKPGTVIAMAEPMGDFVLPKDPSIPLFFVVAGMGITPVRSMVKWLLETKQERQITLLYAVSRPQDLAFHDLFQSYDMKYVPLVKNPDKQYQGATGILDSKRIASLVHNQPDSLIYLSGPEIMVENMYKQLLALGVSQDRLVTDYFHGYPAI